MSSDNKLTGLVQQAASSIMMADASDISEIENNQKLRKTIRGKNPSWRWIAYLAMLLLFGFTVIGMLGSFLCWDMR